MRGVKMKKLFQAIRGNDLEQVKAILQKKPEAIGCISTPPPKKDIGQSPLQVAVKTAAFKIADYLIAQGADVNFMEEEAEGVTFRSPVLQDAVRTVLQSLCYGKLMFQNGDLYWLKPCWKRAPIPINAPLTVLPRWMNVWRRRKISWSVRQRIPPCRRLQKNGWRSFWICCSDTERILSAGRQKGISRSRIPGSPTERVIWTILCQSPILCRNTPCRDGQCQR